MDKYDETISRVINATADGSLKWEAVSPGTFSDIVVNADRVVRAFKAELPLKDRSFPLLFVEKKVVRNDDYDQPYESLVFELNVLDNKHRLIFPIYDGVVDRDDLIELATLITDSSDTAREFFDALYD